VRRGENPTGGAALKRGGGEKEGVGFFLSSRCGYVLRRSREIRNRGKGGDYFLIGGGGRNKILWIKKRIAWRTKCTRLVGVIKRTVGIMADRAELEGSSR